jgi:hypothetical protein
MKLRELIAYSLSRGVLSFIVLIYSSVHASSENLSEAINPQFSEINEVLEDRLESNRQFVDNALQTSRQTLQLLMAFDPLTGFPAGSDFESHTGLSEAIERISAEQADNINNYSELMGLRTANLFDLWRQRNEENSSAFMQTGSLYTTDGSHFVEEIVLDPILVVPPQNYFPGLGVSEGGFFAQNTIGP